MSQPNILNCFKIISNPLARFMDNLWLRLSNNEKDLKFSIAVYIRRTYLMLGNAVSISRLNYKYGVLLVHMYKSNFLWKVITICIQIFNSKCIRYIIFETEEVMYLLACHWILSRKTCCKINYLLEQKVHELFAAKLFDIFPYLFT